MSLPSDWFSDDSGVGVVSSIGTRVYVDHERRLNVVHPEHCAESIPVEVVRFLYKCAEDAYTEGDEHTHRDRPGCNCEWCCAYRRYIRGHAPAPPPPLKRHEHAKTTEKLELQVDLLETALVGVKREDMVKHVREAVTKRFEGGDG